MLRFRLQRLKDWLSESFWIPYWTFCIICLEGSVNKKIATITSYNLNTTLHSSKHNFTNDNEASCVVMWLYTSILFIRSNIYINKDIMNPMNILSISMGLDLSSQVLTRRTSVQQQRYDPSPASHSQTLPEVLYYCQELNTDLGSIVSTAQKIQCFHLSCHVLGTKQKKQRISSPNNENMPLNLSTHPRGDANLGKVL